MTHVPICCQVRERRGDEQAEIVRGILEGAAGVDLHAVDARYHITCYQTFPSERSIKAATRRSATSNTLAGEVAAEAVVSAVKADTDRVWSCGTANLIQGERES